MKTIVAHNSNFHADDVFAVATLLLLYPEAEVKRTRDNELIAKADIVVDVGAVYNPDIDRFDHHQSGGAGVRENGIPYAAFGLVWKKYGNTVAGGSAVAYLIDEKLAMPIDAIDNGVSISQPEFEGVEEYNISSIVSSYLPEDDKADIDECFKQAVGFAQELLLREISGAKREIEDTKALREIAVRNGPNPILILDRFLRGKDALIDFPGILFVVFPGRVEWGDNKWYLKTVRKSPTGFESKRLLPQSWAGKNEGDLARVSGVPDAVFCHKGRFLAAAKSKEGAVALANKALTA